MRFAKHQGSTLSTKGKLIEQCNPGPSFQYNYTSRLLSLFSWSYRDLENVLFTLYRKGMKVVLNSRPFEKGWLSDLTTWSHLPHVFILVTPEVANIAVIT